VVNKDVDGSKHLATREGSGMRPDATVDSAHYLSILKRRKKYPVISAPAFSCLRVRLSLLFPPIYASRSTILIEEQQIPPELVRSTATGFADQRFQILTRRILSQMAKILERLKRLAKCEGQGWPTEINIQTP
jgi:hypothetical protein